ncbi:unnamed protein product [Ranitomeya imitator]|uniref:Solute carrier family 45 member 3 n=1 Tax=Ranitomeya imitator TaxID=111125 RepID=A0ABN9KSV7_9NEOB|nr:unnamed protein product [Ranitomeya imitator]
MQKARISEYLYSPRAQLLLVNSVTCGLEICLAAGVTFVPPLLLEAGVEEKFMTMVLGIGPILGLLVVHLIGSASDRWSGRFGRRRPFIWLLSFGVMLSLIIIPYAKHLASLAGHHQAGLEVFFLILGIGLLDSCGQVCFTPLEALLSDLFPEGEACRKAFSMFALMVGIGACIGYLLPSMDWSGSWLAQLLGGQEQRGQNQYRTVGYMFRASRKEMDLCKDMSTLVSTTQGLAHGLGTAKYMCFGITIQNVLSQSSCHSVALVCSPAVLLDESYDLYSLLHGLRWRRTLSWRANCRAGSEARLRYDEGVRMGSLGLFLQSVTSIVFSFSMDYLLKKFGTRHVYLLAVSCLPIAALITCFSNNLVMVTASAAMTGITFSVLEILPYTLTSLYHQNRQVFLPKYKDMAEHETPEKERKPGFIKEAPNNNGVPLFSSHSPSMCIGPSSDNPVMIGEPTNPNNGICLDIAILDSACLLSQVVPSLVMGFIVQITQTVTAYVAFAGVFGLVAIYFSNKVVFDKSEMLKITPLSTVMKSRLVCETPEQSPSQ